MKIIENITLELTATELEELRRELYAVLFFTQLNNKELNSKLEKTKEFYKVLYNSWQMGKKWGPREKKSIPTMGYIQIHGIMR